MPHFVIHCSENVLELRSPEEIMQEVFNAAVSANLFDIAEIKVRITAFKYYNTGNSKDDFIHIFGNIMEGRNTIQKSNLSRKIVGKLKSMFPEVPILSINIRDFEAATYFNRSMI